MEPIATSGDGRDGPLDLHGAVFDDASRIELDSFIPIVTLLPRLIVDNNEYYVDGLLAKPDLGHFIASAQRVKKLTFTDDTLQTQQPRIASETMARLGMIQDSKNPFLSSLEHLNLIDINPNQSLSHLFVFCIVSSLKSLEVIRIPSTRQTAVSTFLQELVVKVPSLSDITLGPGRLSESSLRCALKLVHLRILHLEDAAEFLDFDFLKGVSSLPKLESFFIDARTAEYSQRDSSPLFPLTIDADSTVVPFRSLRKLVITANVLLIGDIICSLSPQMVNDVSLTLVQNGQSLPLPLHWNHRMPTSVSTAPQVPDDPLNLESILKDVDGGSIELPSSVPEEPLSAGPTLIIPATTMIEQVPDPFATKNMAHLVDPFTTPTTMPGEKSKKQRMKEEQERRRYENQLRKAANERLSQAKEERIRRAAEAERLRETEATRMRHQEEQDKATNIILQTLFFAHIIEQILAIGTPDAVVVDRLEISTFPTVISIASTSNLSDKPDPTEFPPATFRTLLSCPTLREIQFRHWVLPSVEETLVDLAASNAVPMSMERLRLPVDRNLNSGISISTLSLVVRYYPRLIDLEIFMQPIVSLQVSEFDSESDFSPHGLERLSIGGTLPDSGEDRIAVATHLCMLFPQLKDIKTRKGYDVEGWRFVHSLVKMHQKLRAAEKKLHERASATD